MNGTCGPLRSERLDMEPAQPHHADETFALLDDPAMWAHFPHLRPPSIDALRNTYERRARGAPNESERWENWILRDRASGAAVGDLQATILHNDRSAIIAYGVFPAYRKNGYAREAVTALLVHLKTVHGVERAIAEISAANEPSLRLVIALGFKRVIADEDELTFEKALV